MPVKPIALRELAEFIIELKTFLAQSPTYRMKMISNGLVEEDRSGIQNRHVHIGVTPDFLHSDKYGHYTIDIAEHERSDGLDEYEFYIDVAPLDGRSVPSYLNDGETLTIWHQSRNKTSWRWDFILEKNNA